MLHLTAISTSLLRVLRPSPALTSTACLLAPLRSLHTTPPISSAPRTKHLAQHGSGNKLKSHSSTKKRWTPTGSGSGKAWQAMFKRAFSGKSHLNSHMARDRLNRLGNTAYAPRGRVNKTLRRLLGPSL